MRQCKQREVVFFLCGHSGSKFGVLLVLLATAQFLRHARDGKALCETITRVPQPFFRPGWKGRDILVVAIRGLTNFCIVVQTARHTRQTERRARR